ncbi:hypothetical protein fugu_010576 [Takifugu bimaculatus]|uniref:Uncharacterized protein n=1 Tax=Takifugu bimaculatus TaxID=433685 RepID=A0A4Z2CAM7_9TELE|nr:hypothetical protein fugu_010576 [Takifugu bimaculatus]
MRIQPEVQRWSPMSFELLSALQRSTGVMARPGCGDEQQDSRQNKKSTRSHFNLAAQREPNGPTCSNNCSKNARYNGGCDEGFPCPKIYQKETRGSGRKSSVTYHHGLSPTDPIPATPHPSMQAEWRWYCLRLH